MPWGEANPPEGRYTGLSDRARAGLSSGPGVWPQTRNRPYLCACLCDRRHTELLQSVPSSREYRWRWWGLIGSALAVFMSTLDNNVVSVALPIMARQFDVSREIRWVVLAYVLPSTALLGAFGALSDVVGRKRITLIGIALFLAGSVLCGSARSLPQMIVFRIIQGVGGSCVGSAIIAIATVSFAPEERGRAMAIVGLIAPLGAVVGPGIGGLLIGTLGWPSIFYINIPFAILSFTLVLRLLPRESGQATLRFDLAGAALITVALVALIAGLSPTDNGLTRTDLGVLAVSAVAFGLLFEWSEGLPVLWFRHRSSGDPSSSFRSPGSWRWGSSARASASSCPFFSRKRRAWVRQRRA